MNIFSTEADLALHRAVIPKIAPPLKVFPICNIGGICCFKTYWWHKPTYLSILPRKILRWILSTFKWIHNIQKRCYREPLITVPKMVLKSQQWKNQICPIWMVRLVPYAKFWGESEYQDPRSWFFLCILQYPKWCGDTRIRSDDHLWFGWFKLHIDWVFKEILNVKRKIYISQS